MSDMVMLDNIDEIDLDSINDDVLDDQQHETAAAPQPRVQVAVRQLGQNGQTGQALPIRPRQLSSNNNRVRELEERISKMENDYQSVEDELAAMINENEILKSQLEGQSSAGQSQQSNETYVQQLLSAAGVPAKDMNGKLLGLADRVVYLVGQNSLATSTLGLLRNELMAVGHQLNKSKNTRLASDIFDMLAKSSQTGNIVIVSDDD